MRSRKPKPAAAAAGEAGEDAAMRRVGRGRGNGCSPAQREKISSITPCMPCLPGQLLFGQPPPSPPHKTNALQGAGTPHEIPVLKNDRIAYLFPEGLHEGKVTSHGVQYRNVLLDDMTRLKLKLTEDMRVEPHDVGKMVAGEWFFVHGADSSAGHVPRHRLYFSLPSQISISHQKQKKAQSKIKCASSSSANSEVLGASPKYAIVRHPRDHISDIVVTMDGRKQSCSGRSSDNDDQLRIECARLQTSIRAARAGMCLYAVLATEGSQHLVARAHGLSAVLTSQYCGAQMPASPGRCGSEQNVYRETEAKCDIDSAKCKDANRKMEERNSNTKLSSNKSKTAKSRHVTAHAKFTKGVFEFNEIALPRVGWWILHLAARTKDGKSFRFVTDCVCFCEVLQQVKPHSISVSGMNGSKSTDQNNTRIAKRNATQNTRKNLTVKRRKIAERAHPRKQAKPRHITPRPVATESNARSSQDQCSGAARFEKKRQLARKRATRRAKKLVFSFEALEFAGDTYTIFSKHALYQVSLQTVDHGVCKDPRISNSLYSPPLCFSKFSNFMSTGMVHCKACSSGLFSPLF